jgi:hypothetical protein
VSSDQVTSLLQINLSNGTLYLFYVPVNKLGPAVLSLTLRGETLVVGRPLGYCVMGVATSDPFLAVCTKGTGSTYTAVLSNANATLFYGLRSYDCTGTIDILGATNTTSRSLNPAINIAGAVAIDTQSGIGYASGTCSVNSGSRLCMVTPLKLCAFPLDASTNPWLPGMQTSFTCLDLTFAALVVAAVIPDSLRARVYVVATNSSLGTYVYTLTTPDPTTRAMQLVHTYELSNLMAVSVSPDLQSGILYVPLMTIGGVGSSVGTYSVVTGSNTNAPTLQVPNAWFGSFIDPVGGYLYCLGTLTRGAEIMAYVAQMTLSAPNTVTTTLLPYAVSSFVGVADESGQSAYMLLTHRDGLTTGVRLVTLASNDLTLLSDAGLTTQSLSLCTNVVKLVNQPYLVFAADSQSRGQLLIATTDDGYANAVVTAYPLGGIYDTIDVNPVTGALYADEVTSGIYAIVQEYTITMSSN